MAKNGESRRCAGPRQRLNRHQSLNQPCRFELLRPTCDAGGGSAVGRRACPSRPLPLPRTAVAPGRTSRPATWSYEWSGLRQNP